MAHFAKLGANGKVIQVLTLNNKDMLNADGVEDEAVGQQYLELHNNWPAQMWIQTSYNTRNNTHSSGDNSKALRGNYAGIGDIYDSVNDVFYKPQPYNSWTLNTTTWQWDPPTLKPDDTNVYEWNEETQNWDKIN